MGMDGWIVSISCYLRFILIITSRGPEDYIKLVTRFVRRSQMATQNVGTVLRACSQQESLIA